MPKAIRKYPTMLSPEEQLMLVTLGASLDFSRGSIVDLGPFMGGSTSAIGEGLALVQDQETTIHSFDMFAATEQQKTKFLYSRGHEAFDGRNILPLFTKLTAAYNVNAQKGDIRKVTWDQPIMLLFVDLSKSWSINDHVTAEFFPHLAPGAIIVQQDYMFYRNPWVASTTYKLRAHLRYAGQTEHNSLLFECAEPIPASAIEACMRAQTTDQEVLDALEWTGTLVHDNLSHQMLDAMRAAFLANPTGAAHDDFPVQTWEGAFARMRKTIKATQV